MTPIPLAYDEVKCDSSSVKRNIWECDVTPHKPGGGCDVKEAAGVACGNLPNRSPPRKQFINFIDRNFAIYQFFFSFFSSTFCLL